MTDITLIIALIFVVWFTGAVIDLLVYRFKHEHYPNKKEFIDKLLDNLILSIVFVVLGYLFSAIFR